MKKTIALLLCLLMVVCVLFTACDPAVDDNSSAPEQSAADDTSKADETGSKYQDKDGNYTLENIGMPAYNFTQTEFRVCITSNETQTTYYSEEIGYDLYDTTDTVLNEAVKTRNDLIEQNYGVQVVAIPVPDVKVAVENDVTTNLHQYDAAMPFMPGAATMAQEGFIYDLKDFSDYIHLDAPWWDQSANASLSVGGHLYFTTGDISIMQKITSNAITFNKTMYENACADTYGDMYQLVRDKKWTFDKLYEMSKAVTSDSDGEPGMGAKDTYGLSSSHGDAVQYYLASGEKLITKDANDIPTIAIGSTENSLTVAQNVLEKLELGTEWLLICQDFVGQVDNIWVLSLDVFGENRCLFRTTAFSAIKKLRAYSDAADFGIIPMPLITATQDTYYTPASCAYAYGICIPVSADNAEFSAYMIEALCCYAKNTVTPAYYDVTLKSRDAKDMDSEEMLDKYIFNNVVYDLGVVYNFGSVSSMFNTLMSSKSADIVSTLDTNRNAINDAINECITSYEMNS